MTVRGQRSQKITPSLEARLAIAARKIPGVFVDRLQCERVLITADVEEVIWTEATTYTFPATTGESLTLTSAALASADDGVEVYVLGLDENLKAANALVTISGATVVPGLWSRINLIVVQGTQAATGKISLTGSAVFATIEVQNQQSTLPVYSTPADTKAQMQFIIGTMVKDGGADTRAILRLYYRNAPDGVFKKEFVFGLQRSGGTAIEFVDEYPEQIVGPADFKLTGETGSANTGLSARLKIIVEAI